MLTYKPDTDHLQARSGAGDQFPISGVLQPDTVYGVRARIGEWARLETPESRWIKTTFGELKEGRMATPASFFYLLKSQDGGAAAAPVDFADTLVNDYGYSEVWKLSDITSGTAILAHVNPARNGVLTGWALQDTASSIDGEAGLAPKSDGVNDTGNMYSAGFASLFNGGIGMVGISAKFPAGAWTDGAIRTLMLLYVGSGAYIYIGKDSVNNRLFVIYGAGFGESRRNISTSTTDWFTIDLSFKDALNGSEVKVYFNGVQQGATFTIVGAWAGSLDANYVSIGAFGGTSPAEVTNGWLELFKLKAGAVLSDAQVLAMYQDQVG